MRPFCPNTAFISRTIHVEYFSVRSRFAFARVDLNNKSWKQSKDVFFSKTLNNIRRWITVYVFTCYIQDSNGRSVLFYAARYGKANAVKNLLSAGSDANIADEDQSTALHEATERSHYAIIKLLVKHGKWLELIL